MAPTWLTVVAWIYLSVCFACAGAITYDIFVNHRRQPMGVMNAVFPITALYFGPLALAFYWRWGRTAARNMVAPTAGGPDKETSQYMAIGSDLSSAKAGLTALQSRLTSGSTDLSNDPSDPDLQMLSGLKEKLSSAEAEVSAA